MSFKLEDADADVIHAHDDAIDSQILGIVDEIKAEERKYVELLDCISKVSGCSTSNHHGHVTHPLRIC